MEIGSRLKEAREAKKLSLEDVQGKTKIQTRYLDAIEKGNFDIMPGAFYVRAFIKEYASAVGLDPEKLMEEHNNELPSPTDDPSIQYSRVQRSRNTAGGSSTKTSGFLSFLPTLIIIIVGIGLIFTIWSFLQSPEETDSGTNRSNTEEGVEEVVVNPADETDDADENTGDSSGEEQNSEKTNSEDENRESEEQTDEEESTLELQSQETQGSEQAVTYALINPDEEVTLELDTNSEHWLEITNGSGESLYSGIFSEANVPLQENMTDQDSFSLRFGNPADLDIVVNGISLNLPEDTNKSQVHRVTIEVENSEESD